MDRPGTRSRRWPSATSAATIDAIPASLSTPTSAGPSACGDRWTTAAPSPRIAARCFSISWFDAGSSRPLAAKITPRRAHRTQQPDVRRLPLGVALGAAGDHQVAGRRRRVLDAPDDLREIRVGDVVHDDRNHRDLALEQPARERVRDVVERPRRVQHPRPGGRADRVIRRGDDPRRRRGRHARESGDLGDRCHQNGNVGGWSRTVTHCHSVKLSRFASPP